MQMLKQEPGVCSLTSLIWTKADSIAHEEHSVCAWTHVYWGKKLVSNVLNYTNMQQLSQRVPDCQWDLLSVWEFGHQSRGGEQRFSPGLTSTQTTVKEKQQLKALAHTSAGHAPVSQLAFYLSTAVNSNWVCSTNPPPNPNHPHSEFPNDCLYLYYR